MAIQSQKYSGNNTLNNEVTVDFKKKSVDFKPILRSRDTKEGIISSYFGLITYIRIINIKILIWGFIIMFVQDYFNGWQQTELVTYSMVLALLWAYMGPFIMAAPIWNKWWRDNCFPKFNAALVEIKELLSGRAARTTQTLGPEHLGKHYEIPFGNIMLDYEASGDIAKQLKRIEIRSTGIYDNGDWIAKFILKRKAKDGELKVSFI